MKPNVDRRLQVLEQSMVPRPVLRVMRLIINPDRTLHALHAEGRTFDRLTGESDEAFRTRVTAELGWTDE